MCLLICLDSERLAPIADTLRHNRPMMFKTERRLTPQTILFFPFLQLGFINEGLKSRIVVSFAILWNADSSLLFIFFRR